MLYGPSSDWAAITPFHAQMAIPRAVENGVTLVRPTSNGLSLVVSPVGESVVAQYDGGDEGSVMRARVGAKRLRTLYPILGDAFAWADILALVFLLAGQSSRPTRRNRAEPKAPLAEA